MKNKLSKSFWQNLLRDSGNKTILLAAEYFNWNLNEFPKLLNFTNAGYGVYSQRAARAVFFVIKDNMMLQYIYERQIFKILLNNDDISVLRSLLKIYCDFALPKTEKFRIKLFDLAIETFINPKQSAANKSYSLKIMQKIATKYPDLKVEVISVCESSFKYQPENLKIWVEKAIDELSGKSPNR